MAEYKLSYTGSEIDEKLGKIDDLNTSVDNLLLASVYTTPQMYGAKGDGVTDDTAAINECLANNSFVYIPAGTYLIDAGTSIILHSNQVLELDDNATIKAIIPDETKYYYAVTISGLTNVTVRGGKICGDRNENSESTAERGYGIYIHNSQTVSIENCEVCGFRGDCVMIESVVKTADEYETYVCRNVEIKGCEIHNALRHCITVMGVHGLKIKDTEIYDANGKDYSCAMDAEVHYEWQCMSNIHLENVTSHDCILGMLFNSSGIDVIENATVNNCNLHVLDFRIMSEAIVNNTSVDALSIRNVEKVTVNHSVINKHIDIYPSAKKVVLNHCVIDGSNYENSLVEFPADSVMDISSVDITFSNCIFTTFASDVASNLKPIFRQTIFPVSVTLIGCVFNINNPNSIAFYSTEYVKICECSFKYKYNQDGHPSSLISSVSKENYIIGNVFDTTEAFASHNDKFVFDSTAGNVLFANNVGVMTQKWGVSLSYAGPATGRTWTMLNNVFRYYSSKGVVSDGVAYVDIGNIYDSTT